MKKIDILFAEFAKFYDDYYSFLNGKENFITPQLYIDSVNQYVEQLHTIISSNIEVFDLLPKYLKDKNFSTTFLLIKYLLRYEMNVSLPINIRVALNKTVDICIDHLAENPYQNDNYYVRALCFGLLDDIVELFNDYPDEYFISSCLKIAHICSIETVFSNPINKCLLFFYLIRNEESIILLEKYAKHQNLDIQDNAKELLEYIREGN